MKLTSTEIARIEKFLSMRERGMTADQMAEEIGAKRGTDISMACFGLRLIGVRLPEVKGRPRPDGSKRLGRPIGSRDTKPRRPSTSSPAREIVRIAPPRRTFLTAEQWQERLAAQGF